MGVGLADQVCNLELAKRLKELGVKQESYFYWVEETIFGGQRLGPLDHLGELASNEHSAFTVAELGELMPGAMKSYRVLDLWHCSEMVSANEFEGGKIPAGFHAATEADARAKMLIYLIEKGLVKP